MPDIAPCNHHSLTTLSTCETCARVRATRGLLARAPDDYRYHEGLRAALRLAPDAAGCWSPQQRAQLAELYDALADAYPRSSAAQRIPLDFKARGRRARSVPARRAAGCAAGAADGCTDRHMLMDVCSATHRRVAHRRATRSRRQRTRTCGASWSAASHRCSPRSRRSTGTARLRVPACCAAGLR